MLVCTRRTLAAIAAGSLLLSCAARTPSTLTISGPAEEVRRFVNEQRARTPEVNVSYQEGASEAIFEPSSSDELISLAERISTWDCAASAQNSGPRGPARIHSLKTQNQRCLSYSIRIGH